MTEQELAVLAVIGGNGQGQTYAQALDRLEALGLVQRFYDRIPGHRLTREGVFHLENLKARPTPKVKPKPTPKPGVNIHEVWK